MSIVNGSESRNASSKERTPESDFADAIAITHQQYVLLPIY